MSQLIPVLQTALAGAVAQKLPDNAIREIIMSIVSEDQRELDTKAAADVLGYAPVTLKLWRHNSKGPKYRKDAGGRIRYKLAWLNEYMNSHTETVANG